MVNKEELKTHVTELTKRTVQALVAQQGITEAAWLRRLVEGTLQAANSIRPAQPDSSPRQQGLSTRVAIRVRPDDHELLAARAEARNMAPATYVSYFLRAHLRALAPLPDRELAALRRAVAELGAIGRNMNQIARVAQQSGCATGPAQQELMSLLRVCEGLRDHVKAFIRANLTSWEIGYATPANG